MQRKLLALATIVSFGATAHAGFGDLLKKATQIDNTKPATAAATPAATPATPQAAAPIVTFSVLSARTVGDRIIVTGKALASAKTQFYMGDGPEGLLSDAKLRSECMIWGGKPVNPSAGLTATLEDGLPITWNAYLKTDGKKVTEIPKLKVLWEEGDHYQKHNDREASFNIATIPSEVDTVLTPGTVEIADRIYLRMKKAQSAKGVLKLQFTLDNRSGKDFELNMQDIALLDDQGNEISDPALFVANKEARFENPKLQPDLPVPGRLEFKTNIKPTSVKLLRFVVKNGWANFSHAIRDPKIN